MKPVGYLCARHCTSVGVCEGWKSSNLGDPVWASHPNGSAFAELVRLLSELLPDIRLAFLDYIMMAMHYGSLDLVGICLCFRWLISNVLGRLGAGIRWNIGLWTPGDGKINKQNKQKYTKYISFDCTASCWRWVGGVTVRQKDYFWRNYMTRTMTAKGRRSHKILFYLSAYCAIL